jgi:hypothetical protein
VPIHIEVPVGELGTEILTGDPRKFGQIILEFTPEQRLLGWCNETTSSCVSETGSEG